MSLSKPKTIKEAYERVQKMTDLLKEVQDAKDQSILDLREVAGGSTFEYEGKFFQIRLPNADRKDRKRALVSHPFICALAERPRESKRNAKARKVAAATVTPESAEANLATLLAVGVTEPEAEQRIQQLHDEEEGFVTQAEEEAELQDMEPIAAGDDGSFEDEADGIEVS